uniref:Beta-microseminoprotein n=1 Tax=Coturnix japonica TaxID=93934 RepID=A0A8C2YG17_COTJA
MNLKVCDLYLLIHVHIDLLTIVFCCVHVGCISNRNLYVFGAVWKTEDCYQCKCKMNAMVCCSLVSIPKNYDRANCVGLFHKKSCSIRVVKKTNPDISCKVYNGVG